jgi:hypothetical protein
MRYINHEWVQSAKRTRTPRLKLACTAMDANKLRVLQYATPATAPTASSCTVSPVLCS